MTLANCLLLSGALFAIGIYGLLSHRHTIGLLLALELMANAANINMVAFSHYHGGTVGQVFALFSIALTVAEVVVGLAIAIVLHRARGNAQADDANELRH